MSAEFIAQKIILGLVVIATAVILIKIIRFAVKKPSHKDSVGAARIQRDLIGGRKK